MQEVNNDNIFKVLSNIVEGTQPADWSWPPIQQAAPTVIKPAVYKERTASKNGFKLFVFVPDPQIGFRKYEAHPQIYLSIYPSL